jgi:hypothetical protein
VAARRKEVLIAMEKRTFDMRGNQLAIGRLRHFDKEGFVHMVAYRILIFYAIIYGILLLSSFVYFWLASDVKWLTVIFWILITPQLYETVKAFSLISSRGLAFGHLSKEHVYLMKSKYSKTGSIFVFIPYAAMFLWAVGFIALLLWWTI